MSKGGNWKEVQKKTFTRWLNSKLGRESSFKVDDLDSDLKDGMALMTLLSRLFDDPSFLPKGSGSKNRIYQMNNMTEAFNRMKKRGIKLENIGPADIVDGNNKLILGLMWTLVCFSVEQSQLEMQAELASPNRLRSDIDVTPGSPIISAEKSPIRTNAASSVGQLAGAVEAAAVAANAAAIAEAQRIAALSGSGNSSHSSSSSSSSSSLSPAVSSSASASSSPAVSGAGSSPAPARGSAVDTLLDWARSLVSGFGMEISNFGSAWQDGKVLCAMLYGKLLAHPKQPIPGLPAWEVVTIGNARDNLALAFDLAERFWGVPPLLDAEEVAEHVDDKSMITYVASLYQFLKKDLVIPSDSSSADAAAAAEAAAEAAAAAAAAASSEMSKLSLNDDGKAEDEFGDEEIMNPALTPEQRAEKRRARAAAASAAGMTIEQYVKSQKETREFQRKEQEMIAQTTCTAVVPSEESGGSADFETFRRNPQFNVSALASSSSSSSKSPILTRITLTRTNPSDQIPIGFYIVRPDAEASYGLTLPLRAENVVGYLPHDPSSLTLECDIELIPGDRPLIIIPTTAIPGQPFAFTLEASHADNPANRSNLSLTEAAVPPPYGKKFNFSGAWNSENSGGMQDLPTWRKNPQFLLRLSKPGPCRVAVLVSQEPRAVKSISVHIVTNDGDDEHDVLLVSNSILARPEKRVMSSKVVSYSTWLEASVETTLASNKHRYFIVPSCWEPGQEGRFLMTVYCEDAEAEMLPVAAEVPFPNKTFVKGEWDGESAGGNFNEPTWRNNPQFALRVNQTTKATVTLSRAEWTFSHEEDIQYMADREIGMSFHLVKNRDRVFSQEILPSYELVGTPSAYIQHSEVGLNVTLDDPNCTYFIIPSTFTPSINLPFTLTVLSEHPITLQPASKNWRSKKSFSGTWEGETAGGSRQYPTWRLNPTYRLYSKTKVANVTCILSQLNPTRLNIGVEVIRNRDVRFTAHALPSHETVAEAKEGEFTHFGKREVSCEFSMDAGVSYFVIPSTYDAAEECPFNLTVMSPDSGAIQFDMLPLSSSAVAASTFARVDIEGQWAAAHAGGSSSLVDTTYFNNPQFKLVLNKRTIFSTILTQSDETDYNISLAIFQARVGAAGAALTSASFRSGQYNRVVEFKEGEYSYVPNPQISIEQELDAGEYIMIPSSFEAGEEGTFVLSIISDSRVDLQQIN